MKIAMVSRFPTDVDNPRGGVETATLGLYRALRGIDAGEIHILALTKSVSEIQVEEFDGLTVHRLPRSKWPMFIDASWGPSTRLLKRYLAELKPDIVHFHETWGFAAPTYGLPTVFTVHGFDSLNLPAENSSGWWLRSKLWRVAERMAFRKQKYLISIAPYVRAQIEPLTKALIYDIWNSLGSAYFELERQEEKDNVLFLGWLNSRKNPLVLIKAAAKLVGKYPELRVFLCGEASDQSYYETLQAKVTELGLSRHIVMPGRLSQTKVKQQIQRASVMVLPSLQENAPMVIAEAMAAGVPVIATDVCGIPDMIEDNVSGLLLKNPHDPQELAEKIDRLLSSPKYRSSVSDRARQRARQLFHPDTVGRRTLEVYNEVIDRTG